jgi:hypothetical protein
MTRLAARCSWVDATPVTHGDRRLVGKWALDGTGALVGKWALVGT